MAGRNDPKMFLAVLDGCQSEIERLLVAALVFERRERRSVQHGDCKIQTQTKIGRYFADVAIAVGDGHEVDIVVECDGHDFHERTKEQARHDRQRDRWMQASGYKVFRFTGSEIFKDATACAIEIMDEVERLLSKPSKEVA